jgi:hypothetical protein
MKQLTARGLVLAAFVAVAPGALPLQAATRFELGFGWSFVRPFLESTYSSAYPPPLTPASYYVSSSADQTLALRGRPTIGSDGCFNLLFGEHFGVQLLADYHKPGFRGVNSPYHVVLNYVTTVPVTYDKTDAAWPDTSGDLTQTTFSLNGLARLGLSRAVLLSFSGGLSYFYLEGKALPLGFTSFTLTYDGAAYSLAEKTYRMSFQFGPRSRYGLNLGSELAFRVKQAVILALDLRWFHSPQFDCPLKLKPSEEITEPLEEVEAAVNLGTLRVSPSYLRLGLFLRFAF